MVGASIINPGLSKDVSLFYENDEKDPMEFFILPNGSLFMSERLLNQVLAVAGLEGLAFLLLHELAHLAKGDLPCNLSQLHPYGDLRHQLFLFTN